MIGDKSRSKFAGKQTWPYRSLVCLGDTDSYTNNDGNDENYARVSYFLLDANGDICDTY